MIPILQELAVKLMEGLSRHDSPRGMFQVGSANDCRNLQKTGEVQMKRLLALAVVCTAATTTFARPPILVPENAGAVNYQAQYSPVPTPDPSIPPAPGMIHRVPPAPMGAIVVPGQPQQLAPIPATIEPGHIICDASAGGYLTLYPKVRVVQSRKIAPCAVPKIVSVPDPCDPCKVVFIEICVPPCACEHVECSPRKNRTVFNYGKYAVNVTERHGMLVVNYDD